MTRTRRAAAGTASCLLLLILALAAWMLWPLPPGLLPAETVATVTLLDRGGSELRSTRDSDGSLRRWVPLAEIDPDLIAAFVSAEDRRFYDHPGVDLHAVLRAVRANAGARHVVSGASTITMQVARMLRPVSRSWTGKVVQALWALRLERHLTKQQILEQYLNRVPLGQGAVGVDAAAGLYFGASAHEVSLGQAALLAGLAHAPSSDNPLVSQRRARARRAFALTRLRRDGYATEAVALRAGAEPVLEPVAGRPFLAPHFTTRVLSWAGEDSVALSQGTIRTSLDLALQTRLEGEVRHTVETLGSQGVRQAAVVVLDNRTGGVLAWVGSPDFWADTAGQVDMVVSPRQPGSALKPFVYGLAFDRGFTPASILADVAHVYQTASGPYSPRNYDRRFHGPVRAREALASSFNLPAVELANALTPAAVLATLRRAGLVSLTRSAEYYGLGLALGNGDVTLLDLANAYRSLANGGTWRPFTWRADEVGDQAGRRVMTDRSAALVLDILSDPVARIPGFGLDTPFDFPFPVAAKTGTSRHFTDNWAVGVTGTFTVAVWVGNFTGQPMDGVSGVTGAGPLLHRAVLATAARYAPGTLPTPAASGATQVVICRVSGLLAGPECPHATEWFARGTAPTAVCDWHREGRVFLPAEYAEWEQQSAGRSAERRIRVTAPDSATTDAGFRILSPRSGDVYRIPPGVEPRYATVALRAAGGDASRAIRWYVDGRRLDGTRWALASGAHVIRAERAADRREVNIEVTP
jgi:penicillin-binding protein 1C